MDKDKLIEYAAMNIVHQIGDELEIPVKKRQETNDKLINFSIEVINILLKELKMPG